MKSIRDLDLAGKKVLVRVDYNVPLRGDGTVEDDTRVKQTLPTLQWLLERQAALILISHLGRPKGKRDPKLSLRRIVPYLEKAIGGKVLFADDCVGPEVEKAASKLKPGDVMLLENLRFHPEEEKNDPKFAQALASLADFFVQDAFGAVHRAHASTDGIPRCLDSAPGLLLEEEMRICDGLLFDPHHPYIALLGGAKVSDKVGVIKNLLPKLDALFIGGGMAFTFLKAAGIDAGNSMVDEAYLPTAKKILEENPRKIFLPEDCKAAPSIGNPEPSVIVEFKNGSLKGLQGLDIGPRTIQNFVQTIETRIAEKKGGTVFCNGPMGVFELPQFADGTRALIRSVVKCAENGARVRLGGGDIVAAFHQFGKQTGDIYLLTGGGAALEYIEGKDGSLPGIAALNVKKTAAR